MLVASWLVVALPAQHRLAQATDAAETALPLKRLIGETFIVYGLPGGPAQYDAMIAACKAAGFRPRLGQEAPRITSALSLVAAGLGIALSPGFVGAHEHGRRYVPEYQGPGSAQGYSQPRVTPWRPFDGRSPFSRVGQTSSEELSDRTRESALSSWHDLGGKA